MSTFLRHASSSLVYVLSHKFCLGLVFLMHLPAACVRVRLFGDFIGLLSLMYVITLFVLSKGIYLRWAHHGVA